MAGKPKVKNWYRNNRQGENQPDRQMEAEVQEQINEETDERTRAVVDGKDRKQKISGLALEWVTAAWTPVERHEPIPQGSHLRPRDE